VIILLNLNEFTLHPSPQFIGDLSLLLHGQVMTNQLSWPGNLLSKFYTLVAKFTWWWSKLGE